MMTVRESDERSSRFYTEDVQQDYCTYEKLKCLFRIRATSFLPQTAGKERGSDRYVNLSVSIIAYEIEICQ